MKLSVTEPHKPLSPLRPQIPTPMGHGYTFLCTNCGQETDLLEGTGFGEASALNSLFTKNSPELRKLTEKETRETCLRLIADGWKPKTWEYQICYCPDCKTLEQRLSFTLEKDGETYTAKHRCKTCGKELQRCEHLDEDTQYTVTCEHCKKPFTTVSEPEMFRWD